MRLALAQINTVVGDLDGNRDRILDGLDEARGAERGSRRCFPELAVTGYPPEDLLLRPGFLRAARAAVEDVAAACTERPRSSACRGSTAISRTRAPCCAGGELRALYRKRFLPNYGVFDEHRYFAAGRDLILLRLGETLIGPTICEDVWQPGPPATDLALAGAQLIVNISASPYHVGKAEDREEMLVTRARDKLLPRLLQRGRRAGRADLRRPFGGARRRGRGARARARLRGGAAGRRRRPDGGDRAAAARRAPARRSRSSATLPESRSSTSARPPGRPQERRGHRGPFEPTLEQMRRALVLGLRDYVGKNGFGDVVVAVSGGIDSAVTAALCVQALGPERVHCVSMPSEFTSMDTRSDARLLAASLGADFRELSIEDLVYTYNDVLGGLEGLAAENLQARIRGVLLMALSNTYGWLVVSTGNKSELAVGYSTLYGDMVGGFSLLKDVFKTDVFRLARYLNQSTGRELIPQTTIERAPSAELRPDQRDEDSLPPYPELDRVLEAYVELDRSREELLAEFDAGVVERALALVDRAEYKRRQAPPGVKLRPKAFGRDRRTPITNRWMG